MPRTLYILPLLLVLPLMCGCLTTLAISAVAGSGAGGEQVEAAKNTARDVASSARDKADEISLSAHDVLESWTSGSD
jgi:hypothetical protein